MVPRSMCESEEEYLQTLRDDFAAKAMPSIFHELHIGLHGTPLDESAGVTTYSITAQCAYAMADAMLQARQP